MQRSNHSALYQQLKAMSPWEVHIDARAVDQLEAWLVLMPQLETFFTDRLMRGLTAFPPDLRFFTDPEMSWGNPWIWVTITQGHVRVRIKAEYRVHEKVCWIVELHPAA
ncbi:MAG TPA: hypothetical protein VNZ54_06710 [bacterium]|jgi:hypothetical protein|nr:hypothetical protein [bacterium]HXC62815.1 hypothetical protein [bacterium]